MASPATIIARPRRREFLLREAVHKLEGSGLNGAQIVRVIQIFKHVLAGRERTAVVIDFAAWKARRGKA